jgi:DNA-binding transcriptional LysR family regulator
MKTFDLSLLPSLEALLQTCSVSEAAKRMHLSTPAMSHILARIREDIGDPLLVRAGRRLVPTPRALELIEPVSGLLKQAHGLLNTKVPNLTELERTFLVRAPEGVSVVFGAALSMALQKNMPFSRVQFVADSHGDISALREGSIDLDIGTMRQKNPEIETVCLTEQTLVGAVKTGHRLLKGKITAKRFAAERHVGVTLRKNESSPVDEALQYAGLERFVAMTVHSSYGALIVAARSELVASVPDAMAQTMKKVLPLQLFELPISIPKTPMILAWHPRFNADAAHTELRRCMRQVLADANWQRPLAK